MQDIDKCLLTFMTEMILELHTLSDMIVIVSTKDTVLFM